MVEPLHAASVERAAAAILPRLGGMPRLAEALAREFGLTLPAIGRWEASRGLRLVRTAPFQLLALRDGPGDTLFDELDSALGAMAEMVDLSDARAAVRIGGPGAREALSRLLPLDLHPSAMQPGSAASTVAAHIGVLLLQLDTAPTYELLCQRSFGAALLRAFALQDVAVSASPGS